MHHTAAATDSAAAAPGQAEEENGHGDDNERGERPPPEEEQGQPQPPHGHEGENGGSVAPGTIGPPPPHDHAELFRLITRCDVTGVRRYLNREEEAAAAAEAGGVAADGGGVPAVPAVPIGDGGSSHSSGSARSTVSIITIGSGIGADRSSSAALLAVLATRDPWTGFTPLAHAVNRILTLCDADDVLLADPALHLLGEEEDQRRRRLRLLRRYGSDWNTIVRTLLVHGSDPGVAGGWQEAPLHRVRAALEQEQQEHGGNEVERGEGDVAAEYRAARAQLLERTATLLRHYGAER